MSISVQEPGFDGLARTNLRSPSKVVRKRGRRPKWRLQRKGDRRDPCASVLERLPQTFARHVSDCALHRVSSTERVSFRQINKQTGNRLRQQLVDEVTREPVEGPDKGRGYEYTKNAYVPVEDDELYAIAIESNHTIEIELVRAP